MNIEIVEKRENKLLNRTEVRFRIIHEGEKTPERELVKNDLAEMFKVKKNNLIIDCIKPEFGNQRSFGYAKIYKSLEDAEKIEREHILKRNKIGEVEPKEEPKEEEPKEKEPKEKKIEEKLEEPQEKKEEKPKENRRN